MVVVPSMTIGMHAIYCNLTRMLSKMSRSWYYHLFNYYVNNTNLLILWKISDSLKIGIFETSSLLGWSTL
jgi:hypothetical protein